jgi:flagellar biosynthesis protein FlhF
MVTCDTYRVAAVQQLQTYADILGMPLHVADRPEVMPQLLASLTDVEIVIIDTPGRSQRDAGRLDELKAFLDAAQPHETHLVLSGTAGEKVLLREAEAFIPLGVDRIVLTKLDEAVSYGMLVDVLHRIGRSLSFVTTGQEVPADIEPASGDRLADMVLRGHDAGRTLRSFRG